MLVWPLQSWFSHAAPCRRLVCRGEQVGGPLPSWSWGSSANGKFTAVNWDWGASRGKVCCGGLLYASHPKSSPWVGRLETSQAWWQCRSKERIPKSEERAAKILSYVRWAQLLPSHSEPLTGCVCNFPSSLLQERCFDLGSPYSPTPVQVTGLFVVPLLRRGGESPFCYLLEKVAIWRERASSGQES